MCLALILYARILFDAFILYPRRISDLHVMEKRDDADVAVGLWCLPGRCQANAGTQGLGEQQGGTTVKSTQRRECRSSELTSRDVG